MDDTLKLKLISRRSPLELGPDAVVDLLRVIDVHAGPLAPEHLYDKKLVPYSHATIAKKVAQTSGPRFMVHLVRSSEPEVTITLELGREGPVPFVFHGDVPLEWIARDPESRSRVVIDLVRAIAEVAACSLGWAHPESDVVAPAVRRDPYELVDAHWLDVLGPDLVESLGRERVESTPVVSRDSIPGGGVILLTRTTPLDFATDVARSAQARAFAHLTGAKEADVLERLKERSHRLAPVEMSFAPDIAEVLERLVETVLPINRGREIERWNRFRAPQPTEHRPATEQPASDVADVAGAIARYESLYAEQLVALLHPHLPEIVSADPASLPAVDAHFYRGDYPKHFERRHIDTDLVPAVGGYLGMLLVKHLGGRWVPRQNLDESAVIIADRAWLPFLRARHYLASKDSALTHSLTQLYRAARDSRSPR